MMTIKHITTDEHSIIATKGIAMVKVMHRYEHTHDLDMHSKLVTTYVSILHTAAANVINILHAAVANVINILHAAVANVINILHAAVANVINILHAAVANVINIYYMQQRPM